jgi:hypothetical protein
MIRAVNTGMPAGFFVHPTSRTQVMAPRSGNSAHAQAVRTGAEMLNQFRGPDMPHVYHQPNFAPKAHPSSYTTGETGRGAYFGPGLQRHAIDVPIINVRGIAG